MTGSRSSCATAASLDGAALATVSDGRVFTGRQAIELKLIDQLGDEQTALAWLEKEKGIDPQDPGPRFQPERRVSATCRSCTWRRSAMLDAVGLTAFARQPGAVGRALRRSSGLILTVCWRFGTLRPSIERRPRPDGMAGSSRRADRAARDDQVRAWFTQIAAQNPHLYQRDVENIVNAILERDHGGAGARRPGRTARLRRVLGEAPAGAHRAQSAHRRACLGRRRSPCRSSRPARKCASG